MAFSRYPIISISWTVKLEYIPNPHPLMPLSYVKLIPAQNPYFQQCYITNTNANLYWAIQLSSCYILPIACIQNTLLTISSKCRLWVSVLTIISFCARGIWHTRNFLHAVCKLSPPPNFISQLGAYSSYHSRLGLLVYCNSPMTYRVLYSIARKICTPFLINYR